MLKLVMMSLAGLLILFILACGTAAPAEEEAPTAALPTATPPATAAPTATQPPAAMEEPTEAPDALKQIAAELAGKPGAIYVGDISQLAGPAPVPDLGGFDGNVPLESLERHLYLYEHPSIRTCWRKPTTLTPRNWFPVERST